MPVSHSLASYTSLLRGMGVQILVANADTLFLTPEPGKLLAFHLESEGGIAASIVLIVLERGKAGARGRRRVRSRERIKQGDSIRDSNILTVYLQNAKSCALKKNGQAASSLLCSLL